jgi:uncharacterized protein
MSRLTFMDTSFLIALVDKDDDLHEEARLIFEKVIKDKYSILISDAVLIEFGNSFSSIGWRQIAYKWISQILESEEFFEVIDLDRRTFKESLELFGSRVDKQWSLCDCISFVIMKNKNVTEALYFDHHFQQAGFVSVG